MDETAIASAALSRKSEIRAFLRNGVIGSFDMGLEVLIGPGAAAVSVIVLYKSPMLSPLLSRNLDVETVSWSWLLITRCILR